MIEKIARWVLRDLLEVKDVNFETLIHENTKLRVELAQLKKSRKDVMKDLESKRVIIEAYKKQYKL